MKKISKSNKKKLKFVAGFLLIGLIICLAIIFIPSKKEQGAIESFRYSFGSGEGEYYEYKIDYKDGKYTYNGVGTGLNTTKTIDSSNIEKLSKIIDENKIKDWNGFNQSKNNILDGYGFNLKVEYKTGYKIEAQGYMMYPSNYKQGHEKIVEFFESIN